MLVGIHALAGGFIATKIPQPLISYPLILVVHFLMDRIPHWDFGRGMYHGIQKRSKLATVMLGIVELSVGLVFCWLIFQKNPPLNPLLWGGIFLSTLPDFLEVPPLFFNFRPYPLKKFEHFHSHWAHRSQEFVKGIIPQIIILGIILFFS